MTPAGERLCDDCGGCVRPTTEYRVELVHCMCFEDFVGSHDLREGEFCQCCRDADIFKENS